ncbi:MAG: signal peptidase I [Endomicrobium sp.]|jgi:signal peptidase I|nr:signal peptidase I [Endomicrobium sp.]
MELKLFIFGCIFFVVSLLIRYALKYFKKILILQKIYLLLDVIWSPLIIASFFMFFFIQAFKIPSGSMRNTLLEGDHLFVNKFIYGFKIPFVTNSKRYFILRKIKRGDIVVFKCPPEALTITEIKNNEKKDYIKRCVAIEGDKVEIKNKKLYINDIYIEEPYTIFNDYVSLKSPIVNISKKYYQKNWEKGKFVLMPVSFVRDNFGPVIVPKGHYMMMGDNRDVSFDSRFWGPLNDKYIKGRTLLLYWPIKRWKVIL